MTDSALGNAALWSYGLAAVGFIAFAIRLALGWRSSLRALLLLAAVLATAAWAACGFVVVYHPGAASWLASVAFDALRYALWFAFLGSLLKGAGSGGGGAASGKALSLVAVGLIVTGLAASVLLVESQPFGPRVDGQNPSTTFGARLGLALLGLVLVEQLIRRVHSQAQWAIKPLVIGLGGLFAFDLFFYADAMLFGALDFDIWAARAIAHTLTIPFIAIATARNTGWTIEMHVSRGAVFQSTAVLVSGVFLLAIAAAGYFVRYFGGEWGRAIQIELSFAAFLIFVFIASSGSFRSKLRVFVSKHFFSYRYDYREEWLRFTRTLSAESSEANVQERTVKALADLVESPGGVLWLKQENEQFLPVSRWNMPAIDAVEPAHGCLARFMERTGWVIDLAQYATDREQYAELVPPEWISSVPAAWLIVPLMSGPELAGFVVLASPRAAVDVNWEVLDLLKTASRQAASFLGQIRATEALLEARKFDAFNRMSAFVVHDLKNLVAQLSLMLKNAERHRDNPEFQRDMLATVEHVLERMNHLMLQLRTGAAPVEKPQPTDLDAIVRRVCAAKPGHRGPIELQLTPELATIGHQDRLDHVIGHLIQNALDATTEKGGVTVRLGRDGRFVVLEVADTGVGMTSEFVRDRLFKPFETSKASGMGIGVYESAQYVATLGGQMLVDSAPGAGTRVRVLLPSADVAAAPTAEPKIPA
ncbi:MAG: PEP-CTERM system histidine kinase PrsK [Aromatoleum sp.]|nr:PEP-CTERM system histidine kinase PrsK [Aromatoleum sp.]